jgi:tRNA A-37 threonylcarbamoyl transferase component Bud32
VSKPPSATEFAVTEVPDETTEEAADPVAGDHIGHFEVRSVLGHGGMGLVLSAFDPKLERPVAIKLVKPTKDVGTNSKIKARLLREARAMAQFRHPNIVSVFEVGEHEDQVYVAMEKVAGGDLRDFLAGMEKTGTTDWHRIVEIFAKAGRGLAAAHAAGMVHRDFKPDNVLIDGERVLVSDFGIVCRTGSRGERTRSGSRTEDSKKDSQLFDQALTRADVVVGTPAYMAPEQHLGIRLDHKADQFSFCVALYEALYGQLPFAGDTTLSYLEAVRDAEVRPPPPGRRVPEWLYKVLVRGLSNDPSQRFPSMRELLIELGADSENVTRLGGTERLILGLSVALFASVWAAAVAGFDVQLSYMLHYMTDSAFLGTVVIGGWYGRSAFTRSDFNKQAYLFLLALGVSLLVLVAGAHLIGLSPDVIGAFHMLIIGTLSLLGIAMFGRKMLPMALCYLAGFLVTAARPDLFLPLLFTGHMVGALCVFWIFRRGSARP